MDHPYGRAAALAASILFVSTAAAASAPSLETDWAQQVIVEWPEYSRDLASVIIQEYGAPDEAEPSQLTWIGKRPWTRMVVFRDAQDFDRQSGLLQSIRYDVPLRRWRALGAFDKGVSYDPVKHELVVRADDEAAGCLALNLADEVIKGRRTPEDARALYDKTLSLSLSGKSSKYMRGLRFRPGAEP